MLETAMPLACAQDASAPVDAAAAVLPATAGPVTLEWQKQARDLAANRLNALAAARVYAAVGVAQYRAINQADRLIPADDRAMADGSAAGGLARYQARRGAVAGASERVLAFLFPAAEEALEQLFLALAGIHYRFDVVAGQGLGRAVADFAIARRAQ
jgi:hypothetical protein